MDDFYGDPAVPADVRLRQIQEALFDDPPLAQVLLARDGVTLAGFASYSFLWPATGTILSLYLKELYVAAAFRRSGVGTVLMRGRFGIAAARGCSRVEWTTDPQHPGAQAFYEALGAGQLPSKVFFRFSVAAS